jgi:hypothetical protein
MASQKTSYFKRPTKTESNLIFNGWQKHIAHLIVRQVVASSMCVAHRTARTCLICLCPACYYCARSLPRHMPNIIAHPPPLLPLGTLITRMGRETVWALKRNKQQGKNVSAIANFN